MVVVVVLATLSLVTGRKAKLPNFVFMHDESTDGRFVREQPQRHTRTRTHTHTHAHCHTHTHAHTHILVCACVHSFENVLHDGWNVSECVHERAAE
jgi:ABC-type nickel/cobalt efflux system permease component RcnA